jgi:hypothetical protein
MAIDEDKLITQLSHFSIGTDDEALSKQLNNTHLSSRSPFSSHSSNHVTPSQQLQQQQQQQPSCHHVSSFPTTFSTNTQPLPSWQSCAPPTLTTLSDEEEGWGDAPAYTSILQNAHFGFSSNILPSASAIPLSASSSSKNGTVSLDPSQPFSRFSNQPVSFATLTPPAHDIFENQ